MEKRNGQDGKLRDATKSKEEVRQSRQNVRNKKLVDFLQEMEKIIDVTGAELKPGDPENCQGNGEHPDFEICCDECDYFLLCFPEWDKGGSAWNKETEE